MKAIVYTKYGPPDVLQLKEVEKPIPKDNEVLIKVHAATVTLGDCELRSKKIPNLIWLIVRIFFGLLRPRKKILGAYLAGEIEVVGKNVIEFGKGDQVFASTGPGFGAYAEYICLPTAPGMAKKPANATYEEAAALPLAMDALHFLRKAKIQRGERVLVNGAGGSIGAFAVQLAKYFGAEVTGVDSTEKLNMLRSMGADHVIDYTQEDFSGKGETYDIIFDLKCQISFSRSIRSLKGNGRYLLVNPGGVFQMIRGLWISMTSGKKVFSQFASNDTEDLVYLQELMEAGQLKSIIDRSYPLEQIIEAHKYVETGRKKGNIVITL